MIILASASPRRFELLKLLEVNFEVVPSTVDELPLPAEKAERMVARLAALKAKQVSSQYPDAWVIGADTVVALGEEIFGKPLDAKDAKRMLQILQGTLHQVWSGVALINRKRGFEKIATFKTEVSMASMTEDDIEKYVNSAEPFGKAGAYAIQGIGAQFVSTISGSYTNVVGLDIAALRSMLKDAGVL